MVFQGIYLIYAQFEVPVHASGSMDPEIIVNQSVDQLIGSLEFCVPGRGGFQPSSASIRIALYTIHLFKSSPNRKESYCMHTVSNLAVPLSTVIQ